MAKLARRLLMFSLVRILPEDLPASDLICYLQLNKLSNELHERSKTVTILFHFFFFFDLHWSLLWLLILGLISKRSKKHEMPARL